MRCRSHIRQSLIRRAIVSVLLIEFLCAAALVSTALWHEWRARFRAMDVTLAGRADGLIGAVQDAEDPEDNVTVDSAEFSPERDEYYAVFTPSGRLVGKSSANIPPILRPGVDGFRNTRAGGHRYRVFQTQALRIIDREETHGVGLRRPVTVLYAAGTDHIWHELVESANFYLLVSLAVLSITAVALVILLRRLLEPLQQLAERAAEIGSDSLSFDPPPAAMQVSELVPLGEALSAMVARVRKAFETQNRFISDAAHELKTAVSVARSSIQVLGMHGRTPEEYRAGLERVLFDNERVEQLVQQMLSLARFEEREESTPGWCDLGEEVQHAANALLPVAQSRGVTLCCSTTAEIGIPLTAEAARIVASNLVLNAVQHSSAGSEVMIRAESRELPTLVVEDAGSGIAPENLDRVFERFFREDPSRSRETGGSGLGLAICKSIVDRAGGTIAVRSELGSGTTVTVSIPPAPTSPADKSAVVQRAGVAAGLGTDS